jgi:signal transduction histidine kinase
MVRFRSIHRRCRSLIVPLLPALVADCLEILAKASSPSIDSRVIANSRCVQAVHLVRLIDDLLDVSRVSQGKIKLRMEKLQVANVIRAAVEASRPLIGSAQHALIVDVPSEPHWVEGDLTRLAQVVGNLLNNSAKYRPEGGEIRVAVRREGDTVLIWTTAFASPPTCNPEYSRFLLSSTTANRARGGLEIGLALVNSSSRCTAALLQARAQRQPLQRQAAIG